MKEQSTWQDAHQLRAQDEGGPIRIFDPEQNLVLVSGDGVGGNLTPAMRLSEFYQAFYVPVIETARGNSADTCQQNRTAISLWQSITGDPPLQEISQYTCAAFVAGLNAVANIKSRTTVGKHCGAVQKILRFAGPPTRYQRRDA